MRRLALGPSVVVGILLGLVLMRPVILAPVTGDDVYYALNAASDADDSLLTEYVELPDEWRVRVENGRVNVLTGAERRTTGAAMVDAAVATGRPANQVLAVFRVFYLAVSLLAVYALLRTLRWRRRDSGELVRLGGRTRTLALLAGGLAFAVGAQPQLVGLHGWNGWLSYPVSTWTAPLSVFGVAALSLWLARVSAARGWKVGVPSALLMLVIGSLTNYRYELTFLALPVMMVALALVPVSDREHRSAGRRAKWLLGAAYVAGFVPVLVWNRSMLSDVCARGDCYGGVNLSLSPEMVKAFAVNVISSVPGTGGTKISELLHSQDVPTDGTWTPTVWSVLAALLLLATLALAWWGSGPERAEVAAEAERIRGQAMLCAVAALLLVLGALGAAGVMSLSQRAQRNMSEIGLLYRHSVMTWFGLAFGLALLVLAAGLWRRRAALPAFAALGVVLALGVTVKVPTDTRIMAANAARMQPTTQVFAEIVHGDKSEAANQRRCRILRDVDREMSRFYAAQVRRASTKAFERYWQVPFCARS